MTNVTITIPRDVCSALARCLAIDVERVELINPLVNEWAEASDPEAKEVLYKKIEELERPLILERRACEAHWTSWTEEHIGRNVNF